VHDRTNRTGHFRLIGCEVHSHDAYGTPRELFAAFFGVIAETLHELLDKDWSPGALFRTQLKNAPR
jgi:hypothetical protein